VNELFEQGVARPNKSQNASPAFLVPKSGGGSRMVVDYRKVTSMLVFDSYPMPIIEQTFEQFAGAVVFSVLNLNSAYFQAPLPPEAVESLPSPLPLVYLNLRDSLWDSASVAKV